MSSRLPPLSFTGLSSGDLHSSIVYTHGLSDATVYWTPAI